jgi:8-oxo-dGTP pyrophosphatase MutT (NUDIX family)
MNNLEIRCRGIIIHDNKLLVVRHTAGNLRVALPGGHLEAEEDPLICIKREIFEELGVNPDIGRLLYIHTLTHYDGKHLVEFFYEITNGSDFIDCEDLDRSHADELAEILWIDQNTPTNYAVLMPEEIFKDFTSGSLETSLAWETKYLTHQAVS